MRSAVKGLSRCSSQDVDEFDYADDGRNDGNLNTIMSIFGPEIGIKKLTKKPKIYCSIVVKTSLNSVLGYYQVL